VLLDARVLLTAGPADHACLPRWAHAQVRPFMAQHGLLLDGAAEAEAAKGGR
jgi:hypothetical protein